MTFKFASKTVLYISMKSLNLLRTIDTRNSFAKLKYPFRKTNTGQKTLSYIGPSLWNNLPETIKKTNNLNTFKHNVKSLYLNQ